MTMRIVTKNLFSVAAVALVGALGGCAQLGESPSTAPYSDEIQLPNLGLPACADLTSRPAGAVALEDIAGSSRLVVHVGDSSICTGTIEEIEMSGLLVGGGIASPTGRIADSDPMPADGSDLAGDSDPMPADGSHVTMASDSDPMPANGARTSRHTTRAGTLPSLPK
jgi:hypothetical protein